MKDYTIFIGSPDDVKEERKIIENAINETNRYYNHDKTIPQLKLITLNNDVRSMIVNQDPQTVIDKQIEGKYNVFIGILWKKFGSPTEHYSSGTEQEFYNAYEKYKQDHDSMQVMFYFCTKAPSNLKEIDGKQLVAIENFKNTLQNKHGLYKEYESLEDFKEIIKNDLIKLVTEKITFDESDDIDEKDGLLDLLEDFFDNFIALKNEMDTLTVDIYKFADELTNFAKQNPRTREESRKYFDSASKIIMEFSENLETHTIDIITKFNSGISSFNSLMEFHRDLINNDESNEIINAMDLTCNNIDEVNSIVSELIKQVDTIRPITNKFSKSNKSLIKSLKGFIKELTYMKKETMDSKSKLIEN